MGDLWKQLQTPEALTRGWHLARLDTRQDFAEDLYSTDIYAQDLKRYIQETINRIKTGSYQPRPLFRVEVPKGTLAFRPGTVIPIYDRVVLSTIVLLLAPRIDEQLSPSVFSWRLKKPLPAHGPIFRETDITDLPFLKKGTIRRKVDPFEGWYQLWPQFDETTRRLFQVDGYRYLATSDIAAYFENVQLPILRDQLLTFVPDETELVNLLFRFLESWVERTTDGRAHLRGIPQGNFISSFLGNIFLLPLDKSLERLDAGGEIAYFRYMDDVRVFTRRREDARVALFVMARKLRELHLNVQTAKTRIYDESKGQISQLLIDPRVDELSELISAVHNLPAEDEPSGKGRASILARLDRIARDGRGNMRLVGAHAALEGLSLRCFRRWITAHMLINSDQYVDRLLSEIAKSSDYQLTRKLIATAKRFPSKRKIDAEIRRLIADGKIIFPYQEAECLRAIRYLSTPSKEIQDHAWRRLVDDRTDRYLRMEAAYLLARCSVSGRRLKALERRFDSEPDPYVQTAIALILVQQRDGNQAIVRKFVFHPNERVRDLGKFFRTIKNDAASAKAALAHAFRQEAPWTLCDYMPVLHLMACSNQVEIRRHLVKTLREPRKRYPIGGVKSLMSDIFTRVRRSL